MLSIRNRFLYAKIYKSFPLLCSSLFPALNIMPRYILTIESSCDETAAAVIGDDGVVCSDALATQEKLHALYGGVVPELASRAHCERITPILDVTLKKAQDKIPGFTFNDLSAIAVANAPGLAGSLLVGLTAAKTLAVVFDKPLIAVDHLQAHLYAAQLFANEQARERGETPQSVFPCVGLIVSGGHSTLYECKSPIDFITLGSTIDDAAGEAFDKVASMLGLPYPGGPSIQNAALTGNPKAYNFTRSLLNDTTRLDFSFSGLKTAVRYELIGPGEREFPDLSDQPQRRADLAASFQAAVVDCLAGKAVLALKKTGYKTLCVGGGVAANKALRERLEKESKNRHFNLYIPPLKLCTDNAVMGAVAWEMFNAGRFADLTLDIEPGLRRVTK